MLLKVKLFNIFKLPPKLQVIHNIGKRHFSLRKAKAIFKPKNTLKLAEKLNGKPRHWQNLERKKDCQDNHPSSKPNCRLNE